MPIHHARAKGPLPTYSSALAQFPANHLSFSGLPTARKMVQLLILCLHLRGACLLQLSANITKSNCRDALRPRPDVTRRDVCDIKPLSWPPPAGPRCTLPLLT